MKCCSKQFQGNLEHNENQSQMNDERVILDEEATDSLSVSGDDSHLSGQLSEREPALNPKLIDHLLYTQNTTQLWVCLE